MSITRSSPFLAAVLIAVFVVTAAQSVWQKSTTWDEPFHLTAGIAQLQTGDPRLHADHPPLARLIAAIPSLFMSTGPVTETMGEAWRQADSINAPNGFFGAIEDRLLWPARLMMLVFSLLLGWLLYAWGVTLFGPVKGLLPLALFAFCPPLLANAPIVATDIPATAMTFAAVYTWWRYLQNPDLPRLLWFCLSVTGAFCVKFTALLLVPLLVILGAVTLTADTILPAPFTRRLQIIGGGLTLAGIMTVLGINLVYGFSGVLLTPVEYLARAQGQFYMIQAGAVQLADFWPMSLPVPMPFIYVSGLLSRLGNMSNQGHLTYFLGQAGYGGWPNYFLMLLLVKLPIPALILSGLGLARVVDRLPRDWWHVLFLLLPPLLLIGIASHGKLQIGIRHILPAFPFLFLLAGYAVEGHLKIWRLALVGALLVLNALSSIAVHPYYLMYFNFLGGGPEQGWRISVTGDSWGQGDGDLVRWLQARNLKRLAYLPDGWGGPILSRAGIETTEPPCYDTGELVAIHVERLVTPVSVDTVNCYAWMRLREPDEKIGYSIFLYNSKNLANLLSLQKAQSFLDRSMTLYSLGQYQESIAASQQALQIKPDHAEAYNNICAAYNGMKQWDDAIKACSKAISLKPDYELANNNLAWAIKMSKAGESVKRE